MRFQSTLPSGSDGGFQSSSYPLGYFNPRSQAGATCNPLFFAFIIPLFQSTLPSGSDKIDPIIGSAIGNFNPRSQAGATCGGNLPEDGASYFNPRSQAGATGAANFTLYTQYDFNPRSQAGATQSTSPAHVAYKISIHAPKRERRHITNTICLIL